MTSSDNGCLSIFGLVALFAAGAFGFLGFILLAGDTQPMLDSQQDIITPQMESVAITLVPSVADVTQEDMQATNAVIVERLSVLAANGEIGAYGTELMPDNQIIVRFQEEEATVSEIVPLLTESGYLEFVDFAGVDPASFSAYEGTQIATTASIEREGSNAGGEVFPTILTYADIAGVSTAVDDFDNPILEIELTEAGAAQLGEFTESSIGNGLAIVLDGVVLTVPIIQSRIESPVVLRGLFTEAEVETLAAQLNSRPLPVPLDVAITTHIGQP